MQLGRLEWAAMEEDCGLTIVVACARSARNRSPPPASTGCCAITLPGSVPGMEERVLGTLKCVVVTVFQTPTLQLRQLAGQAGGAGLSAHLDLAHLAHLAHLDLAHLSLQSRDVKHVVPSSGDRLILWSR
eukprot:SAG22_NODE_10219_length_547_cov_1.035714_1_plen_130_part_00